MKIDYLVGGLIGLAVALPLILVITWWINWRPWIRENYREWREYGPNSAATFNEERERRHSSFGYYIKYLILNREEP